jgi:hypothetical protein
MENKIRKLIQTINTFSKTVIMLSKNTVYAILFWFTVVACSSHRAKLKMGDSSKDIPNPLTMNENELKKINNDNDPEHVKIATRSNSLAGKSRNSNFKLLPARSYTTELVIKFLSDISKEIKEYLQSKETNPIEVQSMFVVTKNNEGKNEIKSLIISTNVPNKYSEYFGNGDNAIILKPTFRTFPKILRSHF